MDFDVAVVVDEAKAPELVHEKTDARARGADDFRQRLLTDLVEHRARLAVGCPKFASNNNVRARRRSLELNN